MLKCDLQKDGKCLCTHKCAKLVWYEVGKQEAYIDIREVLARLVINEILDYETYEVILKQIGGRENE